LGTQEIFQGFHVTAHFISLEDHLTFSVDCFSKFNTI
jgi:hypothetical protein